MKQNRVDGSDVAIVLGLALLGWSVWLLYGWAEVLAFVGMLLVVMGLLAAVRKGK